MGVSLDGEVQHIEWMGKNFLEGIFIGGWMSS